MPRQLITGRSTAGHSKSSSWHSIFPPECWRNAAGAVLVFVVFSPSQATPFARTLFAYMLLTRRTFLAASLGGAAGVSLPRLGSARTEGTPPRRSGRNVAQSAAAASITSTPLADNLFLLTGAGANVVALK